MLKSITTLCLFCTLTLNILNTQAQTVASSQHFLVAPQCLVNQLRPYEPLATNGTVSFIQVNDKNIEKDLAAKRYFDNTCSNYLDVSDAWVAYHKNNSSLSTNIQAEKFLTNYHANGNVLTKQNYVRKDNYQILHQKEVNQLYSLFKSEDMWSRLQYFTDTNNFPDRLASQPSGVKAENWIKIQVQNMINLYHRESDVSISIVPTNPTYAQSSIVVKFGANLSTPGIVLGAHMDTVSKYNGDVLLVSYKPGADDDGTGVVELIEILRTLLASGMAFNKPIYFVWYAANTEGLVGSQHVVEYFKNQGLPVEAVMNLDMTGYSYQGDQTIWLVRNNTDLHLNVYLEDIIATYLNKPVKYTDCGYACSDHVSWDQKGYKTVFPFEGKFDDDRFFNPDVHTTHDRISNLSLERMTDFAKIAIAFAVELAEPVMHLDES